MTRRGYAYHYCQGCGRAEPRDTLKLPYRCEDCGRVARTMGSPAPSGGPRHAPTHALGNSGYRVARMRGAG